ncbi:MAG: penicillin-binding protein [Propionibacteriaceae bacterium]|jgi:membrane peptidoglycan carboxypeptidase|nr:penicillin-binding protein [Propionibacteriaceae bacterium]
MFLLISVLAGMLVAGLAVPAAAFAGVTSSVVSTSLTDLPVELKAPPLPEPTTIFLSDGTPLVQLYDEYRQIVSLDQIAPIMQKAQVAIEDDRFYSHGALDFKSLAKAALTFFTSDSGGGGSTLTQQYVKQVLVETAATDTSLNAEERQAAISAAQARTLARKITEMKYAIAVERQLSKDQILENYLNIAYFGDHQYGVEAAAHHYFNTSAANLTLGQAATLAGIVQTPSRNPNLDPTGAMERRDTVIGRMLELGVITQAEADAGKAETYDFSGITSEANGCANITEKAFEQICQYVINTLRDNEHLGSTGADVEQNLRLGGYTIMTTIDPVKQRAAQEAVSSQIPGGAIVEGSMVMMQPGTGVIWAAAQNRTELPTGTASERDKVLSGMSSYQIFAAEGQGGDGGSPGGSTFKPFVVGAALNEGIPPTKTFNAPAAMSISDKVDYKGCDGSLFAYGGWNVSNSPRSNFGTIDMYTATAKSVNTYFAQLEQLVGVCAAVTMAQTVGVGLDPVKAASSATGDYMVPAFVLGIAPVAPMQLAVAYSTFAARGVKCDPVVIASIKDRDGNDVATPTGNCQQVIRPEVADGVNRVLNQAFTNGTLRGYGVPGYNMSGKTGTAEGSATWAVGYSPDIVGIANVSADSDPSIADLWTSHMRDGARSLQYLRLDNGVVLDGFGAQDAGPIWQAAMTVGVQGLPKTDFTKPTNEILNGRKVTPPKTAGLSAEAAQKAVEAEGFSVSRVEAYNDAPVGTYLGTKCPYTYGGTCTQTFSLGPRPVEETPPPTEGTTPETGGATGGVVGPSDDHT